ncbi:MAG TPA: 50S ribosomal protein L7ae [Firmicutes bacterium]|nr:50S ribosomal protein L7ae [Bacillota bacterium]HBM70892.1 50S ribosomal protein L7ae [Bacillota bacterium]
MDEVLGLLGLLNKGGKLIFGQSIFFSRKIKLLLLAKDASKNSKEKAINFAKNSSIDLIELSSKEILGQAIGYEEISLVGIIDSRAAKAMKNKIESKGVK